MSLSARSPVGDGSNARVEGEAAIAVMARVPSAGSGKSRLRALLSAAQCMELQRAFLLDTLAAATAAGGLRVHVAYHPANALGRLRELVGPEVGAIAQRGDDLGQRLRQVVEELGSRYQRVILVGSDSPTLQPERLRQALVALEAHDLCLGPALDGGYYLIGLRRGADLVFEAVDWGTSRVLGQTLRNVEAAGLSCRLLDPWYDVDTPSDLALLRRHIAEMAAGGNGLLPRHTCLLLERLEDRGCWR